MTVAHWHTKSQLQMLVALKAAFVKNYLAVSNWILNGSWNESGVRFGSQAQEQTLFDFVAK